MPSTSPRDSVLVTQSEIPSREHVPNTWRHLVSSRHVRAYAPNAVSGWTREMTRTGCRVDSDSGALPGDSHRPLGRAGLDAWWWWLCVCVCVCVCLYSTCLNVLAYPTLRAAARPTRSLHNRAMPWFGWHG